jgi:nucleotide-binding universal stress UspA family protein
MNRDILSLVRVPVHLIAVTFGIALLRNRVLKRFGPPRKSSPGTGAAGLNNPIRPAMTALPDRPQMTHCFPELEEPEIAPGRFAGFPFDGAFRDGAVGPRGDGVRFERLLVPVDLSAGTPLVLRRACALATPGTMVRVLHALQLNIVGEERGIARAGLIHELQEAARADLGRLINCLWTNETSAAVLIRNGRPKDVIVQEARASNADLIVMGARRHSGWWRVLHRNTVPYVIRNAPCPVLVVRT